jgi:glutamine amidotransferase
MCELFCLSSRLPTRATFSLDSFANHGAPPGGIIDGWGIAFYDGLDVRLHKEPEPAGDSVWFAFIKQQRVVSRLIVSHIRRATMGGISLANTQPFTREFGGRMHVFAHNGSLKGIEARYAAAKYRFRPVGETDSEIAFCMLAERLSPLWNAGAIPTLDQRFDVIALFAAELRELGPANFLYADGDALFAHGHRRIQADGTIAPPGLWLLCRECTVDRDGLPHSGAALGGIEAGVTIEGSGKGQAITLLASVPLTSEGWRPLAEGEVIVVKDGRVVDRAADGSMQQGDVVAAI